MITPIFKLDQNDEFLYITIRAPYAKLNEVDVFVESNDFRFYCKPYFLRLNLPGNIVENEDSGTYDFDENAFKFKFHKEVKGQHFDGLDMLTKLLTPNTAEKKNPTRNLIEEVSNDDEKPEKEEEEDDEDDLEWYVEQNIEENDVKITQTEIKYGFGQTKSNVFSKLSSDYSLVIDLKEPDSTPVSERTHLKKQQELDKFDADHYLEDFFDENEAIDEILKYKPEFYDLDKNSIEYTEKEIDCLKSLPKKTYLLDKQEKFYAFTSLIDILYAYCFNNRINCGEKNVESGWTISKLSSTLSWLDTFESLEQVVISSFRRSLCFPFYRNWKLNKMVYKDLLKLLKLGKKFIIKTLIEIRETFIDGECRYILNDLYINDYCVWIQYIEEKKIEKLVECLEKIKITKDMVEFDLECIELSGALALEDQNDSSEEEEESSEAEESDKEEIKQTDTNADKKLINELDSLKIEDKPKKPLIVELN